MATLRQNALPVCAGWWGMATLRQNTLPVCGVGGHDDTEGRSVGTSLSVPASGGSTSQGGSEGVTFISARTTSSPPLFRLSNTTCSDKTNPSAHSDVTSRCTF